MSLAQTDRKTPLGELNWIFTAITDTVAWNVLPRALFQKLFRSVREGRRRRRGGGSISHIVAARAPGSLLRLCSPAAHHLWEQPSSATPLPWRLPQSQPACTLAPHTQDLLVASLFRNYLLAERIMTAVGCTPMSLPRLPPTHQHPMWQVSAAHARTHAAAALGPPRRQRTPGPYSRRRSLSLESDMAAPACRLALLFCHLFAPLFAPWRAACWHARPA